MGTYETIRQALIAHSGTPNLDAFHDEAAAICEALARADEPETPAAPERGSSRVHDPEPMPTCAHGCGRLRWVEDSWYCPTCGDEWAQETIAARVHDPEPSRLPPHPFE